MGRGTPDEVGGRCEFVRGRRRPAPAPGLRARGFTFAAAAAAPGCEAADCFRKGPLARDEQQPGADRRAGEWLAGVPSGSRADHRRRGGRALSASAAHPAQPWPRGLGLHHRPGRWAGGRGHDPAGGGGRAPGPGLPLHPGRDPRVSLSGRHPESAPGPGGLRGAAGLPPRPALPLRGRPPGAAGQPSTLPADVLPIVRAPRPGGKPTRLRGPASGSAFRVRYCFWTGFTISTDVAMWLSPKVR